MANPMMSHSVKRIQVSLGSESIRPAQKLMPKSGTQGTRGHLNERFSSG